VCVCILAQVLSKCIKTTQDVKRSEEIRLQAIAK